MPFPQHLGKGQRGQAFHHGADHGHPRRGRLGRFDLRGQGGRIDRIDRHSDGTYEVIDYKTGMLWRPHFRGEFDQGTLLQHAVYAEAARNILGAEARVALSSYYFCTERGWGEWVRKPGQLDAKPVLAAIAEAMGAGAFLRGADGAGCKWCDFSRACPDAEVAGAEVKGEDPNPGVVALRKLAQYE